jgi:hypothetical protein
MGNPRKQKKTPKKQGEPSIKQVAPLRDCKKMTTKSRKGHKLRGAEIGQ